MLEKDFDKFSKLLVRCRGCDVLNFVQHVSCSKCKLPLKIPEVEDNCVCVLDIERLHGDQKSPPLSVGMVIVDKSGTFVEQKEVFVLPEASSKWKDPTRGGFLCSLHGMFIKSRGNKRFLMRVGKLGKPDVILPTIPEIAAAKIVKEILKLNRVSKILFHGQDDLCLRIFMSKDS